MILCEIMIKALPNWMESNNNKDQWKVGRNEDSWERIHNKQRNMI